MLVLAASSSIHPFAAALSLSSIYSSSAAPPRSSFADAEQRRLAIDRKPSHRFQSSSPSRRPQALNTSHKPVSRSRATSPPSRSRQREGDMPARPRSYPLSFPPPPPSSPPQPSPPPRILHQSVHSSNLAQMSNHSPKLSPGRLPLSRREATAGSLANSVRDEDWL